MNRMRLRVLLLVAPWIALAFVVSTSPAAADDHVQPSIELPGELARVLTDYEVAWKNKDAAGLAALFTEDGFVLSSGRPPVRGRANIEKRYQGSGGPLHLRALAFKTEGSIGYIIGAYSRAEDQPDSGKFTLVLHKNSDGKWMIMSDMDNGNSRP